MTEYSTAVEILQNLVTTVAILSAAFWFVRRRLRYPRARVSHEASWRSIGLGKVAGRIQITIENVGDVMIRVKALCLYVQLVRPLDPAIVELILREDPDPVTAGQCQLQWPALVTREYDWRRERHEIEPGERETYHLDVIIPAKIDTVQIYSHIENRVKWFKKIGWNATSLYDITTETTLPSPAESSGAARSESAAASSSDKTIRVLAYGYGSAEASAGQSSASSNAGSESADAPADNTTEKIVPTGAA